MLFTDRSNSGLYVHHQLCKNLEMVPTQRPNCLVKKKKSPFEQRPAKNVDSSYVEGKECYQQEIPLLSFILDLAYSDVIMES